ncbi:MAG: UDP-N-acetylmuramate dehydrogenase [Vicinamibacterales bacterium]
MTGFDRGVCAIVGQDRVARNAPLAPFTTLRVGGVADWLVTVRTADEVRQVVGVARQHNVTVSVMGGGSNLLVADTGVRGLVIRVHGGDVMGVDAETVRADAGVTINGLVRWTINRGVAGLELWAGTPGTVGGAVYGNAHFQGRLISEHVVGVAVVTPDGTIESVPAAAMEFAYDDSRLQRSREIVVSADFRVTSGEPAILRGIARESLAFRKRTQPLEAASAGCIFQNPDPRVDTVPEGIPPSAGALVDRAGLKGSREGQARVSPTHANFIVNDGAATAADIARLADRCKHEVRERFGVTLKEEIVRLGF